MHRLPGNPRAPLADHLVIAEKHPEHPHPEHAVYYNHQLCTICVNAFTVVYDHLHSVLEYFYHPKKELGTHYQSLPFCLPTLTSPSLLLSGWICKFWNHGIAARFLSLSIMFSSFTRAVAGIKTSLLFMAEYQSTHGCATFCLFPQNCSATTLPASGATVNGAYLTGCRDPGHSESKEPQHPQHGSPPPLAL